MAAWSSLSQKRKELVDTNNLGEALRKRRKEKGLTIVQVSRASGVHPSHLARIEKGERFPSGHVLKKLTEPLGFTEVELLKLAGFLSRDDSDKRLEGWKREVKVEIIDALLILCNKVDSL